MTTIRNLAFEKFMDTPLKASGPGVLGKPLESEFWGTHFIEQKGVDWNHKKRRVLDEQFSQLDKAKWVAEHPKSEPYLPFPRRQEPQCDCYGCRGFPGARHEPPLLYSAADLPMLEQALTAVVAKQDQAREQTGRTRGRDR